MSKILMVCLGNICRSPVAEGILRKKLENKGITAIVDSAGTANYHVGEAPDLRSQKNALKNGVDISGLRGRQFSALDFEAFDMILTMDCSNYTNVLALAKNDSERAKVQLLLEKAQHPLKEVPDPYYGTEADFQKVFDLLDEACEKIVEQL